MVFLTHIRYYCATLYFHYVVLIMLLIDVFN